MKYLNHISLPLVLTFALMGCGVQDGTTYIQAPIANTSLSNVAIGIYPPDMAENIPVNVVIVVDFLTPLDPSSVDSFSFRVENENDRPIEGEITISPDYTQLSFARRVFGQPAPWEPSTTYTVYTRYLKDTNGDYVGDRSSQFTTQALTSAVSGDFGVTRVMPTQESFIDFIRNIRPDTPLSVEFTLPVMPNSPVCDTPVLHSAIQLINVDVGDPNNNLSIPPMDAHICLTCVTPGYCNKITIQPLTPFRDDSLLLIVVRPVTGFVGLSSNGLYENLAHAVNYQRFVFMNYWWP